MFWLEIVSIFFGGGQVGVQGLRAVETSIFTVEEEICESLLY